jgi:hypothetical protein
MPRGVKIAGQLTPDGLKATLIPTVSLHGGLGSGKKSYGDRVSHQSGSTGELLDMST